MAVNLVTVTGNLEAISGGDLSLGRLWFRLNRPDWNLSGDIFAPEYVEAIASAGGAFSVALQSTDDLEAGASYSVILKYREPLDNRDREYTVGKFMLPDGGPYQLGDLLTVPFVEPVPADILVLCQAYAAAAEAAADAAQAWAESPTPPDPLDPTSKSSKTWAEAAAADRVATGIDRAAAADAADAAEAAEQGALAALAASPRVPTTRLITTSGGLLGGGDLNADRTLSIDYATTPEARAGLAANKPMSPAILRTLTGVHGTDPGGLTSFTFSEVPVEANELYLHLSGFGYPANGAVRFDFASAPGMLCYTTRSVHATDYAAPTGEDNAASVLIDTSPNAQGLAGLIRFSRSARGDSWAFDGSFRRSTVIQVFTAGVINLGGAMDAIPRISCSLPFTSGGGVTIRWRI